MDYELGKQLEVLNAKLDSLIEMTKGVGDMVYYSTADKKVKRKKNKKVKEEEYEDEDIVNVEG